MDSNIVLKAVRRSNRLMLIAAVIGTERLARLGQRLTNFALISTPNPGASGTAR